ncbi:M15 family metallopeptidase [Cellulomonas cellasea]|uniref:M15 family metallopeptidase n=1 Tax=Cellulomonas cellasea TaxID=43670 RepID=UPI0025A3550D|nr:M15 family metallopeptidase [Cellulomonas cellasea]MDM8084758.1 M15 family metallopeptidase [Cellulomonas cellasea]
MAYANGRLPASALAVIPGTSRRVRADLLPQTIALRAAFREQFGRDLIITDGYRSYEEQVATKALKGSFAATPGKSVHGWGAALDLGSGVNFSLTSPEHRWMRENGPRFGWVNPDWARDSNPANGQFEPWHHEAVGVVPVSSYISLPGAVPHIPGVSAPTPIDLTGDLIMDAEARAAFDNQNQYAEKILARIDARAGNLDLYCEAIKGLVADVRGAVQITTDNAYSGATISQTVLNSIVDPSRGLAVQLAHLSAEVAALRASGATTGTVDVAAIADTAAREALSDLADALTTAAQPSRGA